MDFEVLAGDRRGRSEMHFKVLYTTKELAHQAEVEAVADNTGKYIKLFNKALHRTLKDLRCQTTRRQHQKAVCVR